ncbi:1-deoxy-D-xylulose-5-phosphate reductoisomerase [Mycoplasmatota bacterium]|nr:1-deoxy-D-xylulose-5-phosphate reductoisomerase [Mycoplasmatota bacterium]
MKNIFLLGATGSIGTQTLEVIEKEKYNLVGFSAGYNIKRTIEIIEKFKPKIVSIALEKDFLSLKELYPGIEIHHGDDGLVKVATFNNNDGLLVNAVVGSVGLIPTVEAIKVGKSICLANKETLVIAGDIITNLVKEYNVDMVPIDSEHSAIFQCLNGENRDEVEKIVITASGGAFRDKTRDELVGVSKKEALDHPNWAMGDKITIDSATMMNKGLEVIEAHHLFNIPFSKIETIIHYESIIHSMVEFIDGSVLAHLGLSDMTIPIAYALSYPNRIMSLKKLDFDNLSSLSFSKMDYGRFPLLKLAYEVGEMGGIMPCVMNAANEAAVELFLNEKISFLDIEKIVFNEVRSCENINNPTLDDIIRVDKEVYSSIILKNK